jgi:hypothetical protein
MTQSIKDGQKLALIKLCQKLSDGGRDERLFIVSELLGKPVESFNDLTIDNWRSIRDRAYPNWSDDNWEIGKDFAAKVGEIVRRYQTQVLGQLSMF